MPILLEQQGILKYFKERLNLPINDQPSDLFKWKKMADRYRTFSSLLVLFLGKRKVLDV